jgi:hypothetical protein
MQRGHGFLLGALSFAASALSNAAKLNYLINPNFPNRLWNILGLS